MRLEKEDIMNKFCIVAKKDEKSVMIENKIEQELCRCGWEINKNSPELIICIGGDGTFLHAIHKYMKNINECCFLAIHTGTLGFFTNYTSNDVDLLADNLLNNIPSIDEYSLIEVTFNNKTHLALNEIRVENNYHTQEIDIYLNEQYLQTFKGNGICLATAIGSTGYNRSLKGPIIHPSLDVMIMSEIAAIQHRYFSTLSSPLVMGRDTEFKMVIKPSSHLLLGIDHEICNDDNLAEVKCKLSDKKIKMLNYNEFTYVQRLRKAFLEKD